MLETVLPGSSAAGISRTALQSRSPALVLEPLLVARPAARSRSHSAGSAPALGLLRVRYRLACLASRSASAPAPALEPSVRALGFGLLVYACPPGMALLGLPIGGDEHGLPVWQFSCMSARRARMHLLAALSRARHGFPAPGQ
ncbi:hypothetical protein T492DRAFT_873813 [Pavlovales sp. CCMP2436]|nr:hypothetical protein T492DRAFT_873813 [Pavlovales sp. CCMP2436]